MNRDECWMTFSEALESYLSYRHACSSVGKGATLEDYKDNMRVAAEHMDALTAPLSLAVDSDAVKATWN